MAATVHIHHRHFNITQPESWYSFYGPMEGERLSRPRHCSKGAQPVPKAVYRSGCHDKQLPVVRFEPGSSHTAVRHVTARPLRHFTHCRQVRWRVSYKKATWIQRLRTGLFWDYGQVAAAMSLFAPGQAITDRQVHRRHCPRCLDHLTARLRTHRVWQHRHRAVCFQLRRCWDGRQLTINDDRIHRCLETVVRH